MGTKRPPLSEAQILAWADAHHARTGRWPSAASGPVCGVPWETWQAINLALGGGYRGLPRGDTLARLLARHGRRRAPWDRGTWTAQEDRLVRSLRPAETSRRTGRPLGAVYRRRQLLRVTDAAERSRRFGAHAPGNALAARGRARSPKADPR
jgi:hypothetical protein